MSIFPIPQMKLKINKNFTPCPVDDGDELFPNGIFEFNITKILSFIEANPGSFVMEQILENDFPTIYSRINESHIESVDISHPVILAEIAPGKFNLIDGNHRMEKARRLGVNTLSAFRLTVEQHINFLTTEKAYLAYIEYWNSKLKN
jgi:hypothetical protein